MSEQEYHPFRDIISRKIKLIAGEEFDLCFNFVQAICSEPCRDRISGHRRHPNCHCLSILEDNVARQEAVAKYMAAFAKKPVQEKHSILIEWIRYTTNAAADDACFYIPFISEKNANLADEDDDDDDDDSNNSLHALKEHMVCRNAICHLLWFGQSKWKTCTNAVKKNILPVHGNKGKITGKAKRFRDDVADDLHEFFHQMEQFATPQATRFVREETGAGLRDGEEGVLELPSSWSKRSVYGRFCFERGIVVTSTHTGNILKAERSDPGWDPNNKKPICSWWAFLKFWEKEYKNIRIASPSADICTDCHVFFNRSKYATRNLVGTNSDHNDNSTNSINYTTTTMADNLEAPPVPNANLETPNANLETASNNDLEMPQDLQLAENNQLELTQREATLQKASLHVKQALIQRALANQKIQEAIDTVDLPHCDRHYCFIADFSQNMELPFFGASQPGDTYYYSPLKINVFGIVDCSIFGGKLSVHVYDEGVGKKGGNNVASMLVKELKRLNIMQDNQTGKELTFVMDNCAGQNKNRMVLRLATYLVEAEYFEKVSFVFYIVGHTKNACDRWFNMLKKTYRRQNIYSFDQLTESMRTHNNITVTVTKESDFKDWDKFFDSFYKRLASGTTHKTHIFSATKGNKTTLLFRDDDLPDTPTTAQDLLKRGTDTPDRFAKLRTPVFDTIDPPGVPPIKQVELFTKYRALLPEAFRDITCPDPGDEITKKIKSDRNTKQRERKKTKKTEEENKTKSESAK